METQQLDLIFGCLTMGFKSYQKIASSWENDEENQWMEWDAQ